jgi:hypothetical protein
MKQARVSTPPLPATERGHLIGNGPAPGDTSAAASTGEALVRQDVRLSLLTHLLVVGGYVVLTVALTYPIAFKLFDEVPGGGDAWQHIWNLWWVKEALLNLQTNPYHTDLVYYPDGASLYFHTLVLSAGLAGIPLQLLGFNLIATYNLVLLSTFVLAGYGAFLLCHYLTRHVWASVVGGFVFAFSPYHFAHLFGHMNLASLQWIPFYVLVLLKAIDGSDAESRKSQVASRRSLLMAAGAGALLALNAYTDWLYAIFLVIFTGLLLAWKVLVPGERRSLAERGVGWREAGLRLVVGFGVFMLLVSPVFFPTLAEARAGYAQQPPLETLVYSSDLTLAFVPSELHPVWGKEIAGWANATGPYLPMKNPSERVVFVGYAVLALALYTGWRLRNDRQVLFWLFAAVATWLLSLGPLLQILGKTKFTAFEATVPLPYLLLYKLPLLNIMRTPSRLTVLTMLALGVLAAFAIAAALRDRRGWAALKRSALAASRFALFGAVLPALIVFEFLALPFPMVPPGWGVPIYAQIAREEGDFALLELPLRPFGDYMAYQTVHGKPIVGGYLSRQPPYAAVKRVPALKYLLNATAPDDPLRTRVTGGEGAEALRELRIKYVIIRWWAFTPEEKAEMQAKLDALLGRPPDFSYERDQVDVWRLFP